MNKAECAAELYELIVVKGRWKDNPPENPMFGNHTYDVLPEWMKEMWRDQAVSFAEWANFKLED